MNGARAAIRRRVVCLFRGASDEFRSEVVAPFLDDWRRESESARRRGVLAARATDASYLACLPALGLAALTEKGGPMTDARLSRLAARGFYVAAVVLLFVLPRATGGAGSPAEVVTVLAACLGLGLALVAVGLLLEMRQARLAPGAEVAGHSDASR